VPLVSVHDSDLGLNHGTGAVVTVAEDGCISALPLEPVCLSTSAELLSALQSTRTSATSHTLRLERGEYRLEGTNNISDAAATSLGITGGWGPGCQAQQKGATGTRIVGDIDARGLLVLNYPSAARLEISDLTIEGFGSGINLASGEGSPVPSLLRLERVIVRGQHLGDGVTIWTGGDAELREVIVDSQDTGCALALGSSRGTALIASSLTVLNTSPEGFGALCLDGALSEEAANLTQTLENSIIQSASTDLTISPPAVLSIGNVFRTFASASEPFAAGSFGDLRRESISFEEDYVPTPGSASIDSGLILAGSEFDALGGQRVQGSSLDRGAVERTPTTNQPPVGSEISDQTMRVGSSTIFDLEPFFTDPDGDRLTFDAAGLPARVELSGHVLFGTPTAEDVGIYAVTITASDSQNARATTAFQLSIVEPNQPPIGSEIPDQTMRVGTSTILDLEAFFTDPDGDHLTFEATGLPLHVELVGHVLFGTPAAEDVGTYSITVTASDTENASATTAFQLVIVKQNKPPVASDIPDQTAPVGVDTVIDLRLFFADPDGDSLTFEATGLPPNVELTDNVIVATPTAADVGTYQIKIVASDGLSGSVTTQFQLQVVESIPAVFKNGFEE
jgi:hypothetical protein